MTIHVQGHIADPVHRVIGLNKPTGGTVSTKEVGKLKETALIIKEATKAVAGVKTSAHNCYGVGNQRCGNEGLLEDGKPMKWEPIYKPKTITKPTTPPTQNLCKDLTDGKVQQCNSDTN